MNQNRVKKSALVCALSLSMVLTGCGVKENNVEKSKVEQQTMSSMSLRSTESDIATASGVAADQSSSNVTQDKTEAQTSDSQSSKTDVQQSTESKDKNGLTLTATFDDGQVKLDSEGLVIKDGKDQVIIKNGEVYVNDDKNGKVILDANGIRVNDGTSNENNFELSEDGLFVKDSNDVVSWDENGFQIKSDDCNLNFNFAFPNAENISNTLDFVGTKFSDALNSEEWREFTEDMSNFVTNELPNLINEQIEFCNLDNWKSWNHVTIMDCDAMINNKSTKVKMWFEDGSFKTMNIPEENIDAKGISLIDTKVDQDGNVIRTYR